MKYTVTAYTEGRKFETIVSCRPDASLETLFVKCANEIALVLRKARVVTENTTYGYCLPSIYNGVCGTLWFNNPFINITIIEGNGSILAQ